MSQEAADRPVLRVIRGDATPEEVAAILAIVSARSRGGSGDDDGGAQLWSAHGYGHRNIRATFSPSPHGWRTSFWPR